MRPATTPPSFMTLVLLPGIAVVSLNMFLPSLPQIALDLDATYAQVSWAVAGYLVAVACLQLILGPLSDRYGRRPIILWALSVYVIGSVGCILSQSLEAFLAWRLVQSLVIGGSVVSMASVRDTHEAEAAASRIAYIASVFALGPMLGPMLGGFLAEFFSWRAIFVFQAVAGLLILALVWVDFGETNTTQSETFGAQFRAYPELLGAPAFWAYAASMAFGIGAFYTFITGAPLVAKYNFDLTPGWVGLAIGVITMGFFVGTFITGRISQSVGIPGMVLTGRTIGFIGMLLSLTLLSLGVFNPYAYFGCVMLLGFANGFANPTANAGLMSVRPDLAGSAAGLSGFLIMGLGAVLTRVSAGFVDHEEAALRLVLLLLTVAFCAFVAAVAVWRLRGSNRSAPAPT